MVSSFNRLPEAYQGILFLAAGIITLLYALGIIGKSITTLIIIFAVYAILVGCNKLGITKKILHLFGQR